MTYLPKKEYNSEELAGVDFNDADQVWMRTNMPSSNEPK